MNSIFDPNTQIDDTAAKVVFSLERLSHVFRIQWWRENKKRQLSPLQMQILLLVKFQPDVNNVSSLAHSLGMAKATISDAVKILDRKAYLVKQADPTDGRRQRLRLTEAGHNLASELSGFANDMRDYIQTLPQPALFLEMLLLLTEQLQRDGHVPPQRMCFSCSYFQRRDDELEPYYCHALQEPLRHRDLRINCMEHKPIG